MAFLVSPGVNTSEIDLTASVPGVGTTTGGTVGFFKWGPANTVIQVSSESDLLARFTKPDGNTALSFLSATNFLTYGNDLRIVRVVNETAGASASNNAVARANSLTTTTAADAKVIANEDDYFADEYNTIDATLAWAARYPGVLGNSLRVSVCSNPDAFSTWVYAPLFDRAPNTSAYALGATNNTYLKDELHVIVVDEDGVITGTANTVLERFPNLSKATDAKGDDGSSIYYKESIYRNSQWIHWLGHPTVGSNAANGWGQTIAAVNAASVTFHGESNANNHWSLVGGNDGTITLGQIEGAIDRFNNTELIDVSLLFVGDSGIAAANLTANNAAVTSISQKYLTVASSRKDTVAFVSPPYANSVTSTTKSTAVINFRNGLTSTSYGVMDSGWKYQYDKYNDVYRWVPLNPDIAGLCVRTDTQRDPWFSPAGIDRGQIRNLVKLSFNPTQSERDTLYKAGVNPVVSFPGEGTLLFGDKTLQGRPSAFDRINVRRLFIVLEKAISRAARSSLFEINDEFTRAQFVALVEPFLRDVQGRRGIYDFRVVCDETNNTSGVVDRNEFIGDIYIKPARSVNFIQLNFVAVRSGVSFDEIVGRF
jgi:hypothetical protein